MGVYWALNGSKEIADQVEILDLRTLAPYDEEAVMELAKRHGKVLVLTEETRRNSFAEALAGRIGEQCFVNLDAPVQIMGSEDLPAVPLNTGLEAMMLPNAEKTKNRLLWLLSF
jgi:2-oxoisovalerate dehydrogenase E1 component